MKQKVKPQSAEDFVYRFIRNRERKEQLLFVMDSENTAVPGVRTVHAIYHDKGYRFVINYEDNSVVIIRHGIVRYERYEGRLIIKHTDTEHSTVKNF